MEAVSLADAKARLSELVDRVEAGHTIDITRRGKRVARLMRVTSQREPIDLAALRAVTDALSPSSKAAGEFVRSMRDADRY